MQQKIQVILIFTFSFLIAPRLMAQLSVVSIIKDEPARNKTAARFDNLEPKSLPFWDDFSFSFDGKPVDTLWINSDNVRISQGIGINPLSVNVASFDGTNASGRPYSTTDPLAVGLTDSLVSWPLRMTEVPLAQRNTVFISFYYQYQGRGEAPDLNDEFFLEFRNNQLQWERVWGVDGSVNVSPTVFNAVILPVNQPRFFHDQFQFRFRARGRQSGPFDTWNLDYVYLNRFRNNTDLSFPDRSVAAPLSSLFGVYWAIPLKHFKEDPQAYMQEPRFGLFNLKSGFSQPINYDTEVLVKSIFEDEQVITNEFLLEEEAGIGGTLQNFERRMVTTQALPQTNWFDADAKAIEITYKISVSTKDNVPPEELGDYEARYIPIDFRWNDTTRTTYKLGNYYAYDDGEAEFAAGLNASGARLAYYFEPLGGVADTLVSVDIYFPFVGINETAQIDLIVLRDLDDDPGSLLHMQTINVQRSGNNEFVSYPLAQAVIVSNPYYLGWRQRGTSRVDVGLDKNNNTGERMFFNVGDNWQQNVSVQGSLMIRPVIGKATGLITGVAPSEKTHVKVWPNPSHDGKFWVAGKVNAMEIRNQFGQAIRFNQTQYPDFLEIDLQDQTRGMYILRIHDGSKLQSIKLIRQ